jgi:CheY-like chemotaxis protein
MLQSLLRGLTQAKAERRYDESARKDLRGILPMNQTPVSGAAQLVQATQVVIVDDNQYMRKIIRNVLVGLGVKNIHEAGDGIAELEAIRMYAPDVVILDWEMPLLSGPELVRIIRSPGVFPSPDVAIIMLTGYVERWRVVEASRLGVNEFLRKPVSAKALLERLISIIAKPRPMVRIGDYYGPAPRRALNEIEKRPALTLSAPAA